MNSSKIIILLAALLLVAAVFTGCRWWGGSKGPDDTKSEDTKYVDTSHGGSIGDTTNTPDTNPLSPDYPLPPEDTGAESIEGDETGKLDKPSGGGSSVSLIYMKEVEVELESGDITLLFGNPSKSNQDMVLTISIQDRIVARSGLIKAGNRIRQLTLNEEGKKNLVTAGVYEGKLVIENYDPLSGEKAIVNIEIPITITVK